MNIIFFAIFFDKEGYLIDRDLIKFSDSFYKLENYIPENLDALSKYKFIYAATKINDDEELVSDDLRIILVGREEKRIFIVSYNGFNCEPTRKTDMVKLSETRKVLSLRYPHIDYNIYSCLKLKVIDLGEPL